VTRRGARLPRALLVAGAALALVLVAAAALWLGLSADEDAPPIEGLAPRPAAAFADSVGVNVHLTYYDTAYDRIDAWLPRLRELGVRHVRDGLVLENERYVADVQRLGRAGLRANLIAEIGRPPEASAALAAGPLRGAVRSIEAPNEPDVFLGPDWEPRLRGFLPQLQAAVDAAGLGGLPLLAPSLVQPPNRERLAGLRATWDAENVHPYPGGRAPHTNVTEAIGRWRVAGREIWATETGYHNAVPAQGPGVQPGVPEDVSAAYLPRLLLEYFGAGVRRTYLYELLDEKPDPALADAEQHFGLLRNDLTPKPAFLAVRNLLRLVRETPGAGERRPVRTDGGPADLQRLVLEREDGSRLLLLWRRTEVWDVARRERVAVPEVPVRVAFGGQAEDVAVHRPTRSARALERRDGAGGLDVGVGPEVVAVSFR
jgi:hypothetical protein